MFFVLNRITCYICSLICKVFLNIKLDVCECGRELTVSVAAGEPDPILSSGDASAS